MKAETLKPSRLLMSSKLPAWLVKMFQKEPDEVVIQKDQEGKIKGLGKKHAALIMQYTAIQQKPQSPQSEQDTGILNNAVLKYLFAESQKGLITEFLSQVNEHEPEKLGTLQNNLAHYMHGAIEHMLSSTGDEVCLSNVIEHIFEFSGIADTTAGSLSAGLQDAVVTRVRSTVEKAAERQLKSILGKKGQREALAYPDLVEQYEICRKMKLKDFLLDHLEVKYSPKKD